MILKFNIYFIIKICKCKYINFRLNLIDDKYEMES